MVPVKTLNSFKYYKYGPDNKSISKQSTWHERTQHNDQIYLKIYFLQATLLKIT